MNQLPEALPGAPARPAQETAAAPRERPALSVLACDLACAGFAVWTVLCNGVVICGGSALQLRHALFALLSVSLVGVAYAWYTRRIAPLSRAAWAFLRDDAPAEPAAPAAPLSPRVRLACFALGGMLVFVYARRPEPSVLWLLALPYFLIGYALLARSDRGSAGLARGGLGELLLWALAFASVALTLTLHRPDTDDTFYANVAVSAVDFPHEPLLSRDTLHGVVGAPFKNAVYKATSIELATGLASALLGVETLAVYYLGTPALWALLLPLALARLFRLLDGERWPWAVLAAFVLLALDGGGGRGSFADFAFPRLFQGKAVFVSVLAPVVLAHGIRFGQRPTRRRFAVLALMQIAALGCSVTAFWAAPSLALTGTAVGLASGSRLRALSTLLAASASSGYLVALGLYLKLHIALGRSDSAGKSAVEAIRELDVGAAPLPSLAYAYEMVLGADAHRIGAVAVALLAWPLCRTAPARRFAVLVPLAFCLLAGNPWLTRLMVAATTPSIYWRVLWLLPWPLLGALAASALISKGSKLQAAASVAAFGVALALVLRALSPSPAIAAKQLSFPRIKADPNALLVARALVRHLPPHSQAAAPEAVSRVLPMLNGYSYPFVTKVKYLPSSVDYAERAELTRLLGERRPTRGKQDWLLARLDRYGVAGLAAAEGRGRRQGWAAALEAHGFTKRERVRGHGIWVRDRAAAPVLR